MSSFLFSTSGGRTNLRFASIFALALLWIAAGCQVNPPAPGIGEEGGQTMATLNLSSTAFGDGEFIPVKYTCDAENFSPPLDWSGLPAGTQSLALITDDPDAPAGTWVHWVLFNLSPALSGLEEGASQKVTLENLGIHGTNDFRKPGYGGPCPPPGKTHRYFFKLYALDAPLELKPGATKGTVELAMQGHILAQGQLMGKYKR